MYLVCTYTIKSARNVKLVSEHVNFSVTLFLYLVLFLTFFTGASFNGRFNRKSKLKIGEENNDLTYFVFQFIDWLHFLIESFVYKKSEIA